VNGSQRFRWQRLSIVVAAALVMPVVWMPAANADPGPATFVVQGSVEQFAVTHATPGATISLDDRTGHLFATGTLDTQGSFLFRSVPAGAGYTAVENDAGTVTESAPTTVLSPSYVPPKT
jgi:hypothetical protein